MLFYKLPIGEVGTGVVTVDGAVVGILFGVICATKAVRFLIIEHTERKRFK